MTAQPLQMPMPQGHCSLDRDLAGNAAPQRDCSDSTQHRGRPAGEEAGFVRMVGVEQQRQQFGDNAFMPVRTIVGHSMDRNTERGELCEPDEQIARSRAVEDDYIVDWRICFSTYPTDFACEEVEGRGAYASRNQNMACARSECGSKGLA